ncbi:MAG: lamin tail domain-containing protein, partial [Planctomycetes bacterium]|nr:lamin tail domain-containing protein [Planctomycetota bacterium]
MLISSGVTSPGAGGRRAARPGKKRFTFEPLERRTMLAADPIISELMADNDGSLLDGDGNKSDWIEIYNDGDAALDLAGWKLADSIESWTFPARQLRAGEYLVVFASNQSVDDYVDPQGNLHTNFALSAGGEYLALLRPDGTVASEFLPEFPAQLEDVSFGPSMRTETLTLVADAAEVRTLIPTGPLDDGWRGGDPPFDDATWTDGAGTTTGVGYADAVSGAPGLVAQWTFETAENLAVVDGQWAGGQVDETAGDVRGPFHGSGSGSGLAGGINYAADAPEVLTDSVHSLVINEANPSVESVALGMPAAIAELTTGDFSLQTWFKTTDTGRSILMGSYVGSVNALNFELHTGNRLRVYIQHVGVGTTDLNLPLPTNSRNNAWHSATAVRRGSNVELYYDGTLVGQRTDVAGSYVQAAPNYFLGRDSRTGSTRFNGRLDNVRFWNVALTPEQIADMAAGATPAEVSGSVLDELIRTDVETPMRDNNASALLRIPFEVADPAAVDSLLLKMKYDDAFVAYINGLEVARSDNAPASPLWNSTATSGRGDVDVLEFENFDVFLPGGVLVAGTNILAIQGLNETAGDDDFLMLPELLAIATTVDRSDVRFFTKPTPGEPNDELGVLGFVDDTAFSVDRGFYEQPFQVEITSDTLGAEIRYTIDGSWPTAGHGTLYTDSISITTTTTLRAAAFLDEYGSTNVDTHTYIFLDDVIRQPANPGPNSDPAYPLAFPLTHQPGFAADYQMDPDVVNHPLYAETIKNDLLSIPTLSLVMDMDDVFNQPDGIWSNSQQSGLAWERLTSVEYIDPNDPTRQFQLNSAVRSVGRAARVPSSSIKHSFRLIFKDTYGTDDLPTGGPTKLKFPWFENSPVERFDTIVLRGGYNYSYNHNSDSQNRRAQFIRERFMREAQLATGQLGSSGSYVHLYVNGLYFGLYAPQERPDASFMAQHLGGDKEDYDVISAGEVRDGDADAWNEVLSRAAQNLSISANYDALTDMVDVESLIDYMIVHIWGGTTDWPAPGGNLRNWVVGRKREDGAGFKFFIWDAEYSIQGTGDNRVNVGDARTPAFLYARMRANPEFRLRFADRLHKHFFNDGALTPQANIDRYRALADNIDRAIVGESARWGDSRQTPGCNPCLRDPQWVAERNWILNNYMPGRTNTVLTQFIGAGLYPRVDAPSFNQHGGDVAGGFLLTMQNPGGAGTIYYTLDGSDPRLPGGAISDSALVFNASLVLNASTTVKARVHSGGTWSAVSDATFIVSIPTIAISEIHFNPAAEAVGNSDNDDFEFIEFYNYGSLPVELDGVRLVNGIDFDFTDGGVSSLAAGQYAVAVQNLAAFATRYDTDGMNIIGEYFTSGTKLSNAGEKIALVDAFDQTIAEFRYKDGWYNLADGAGFSLTRIDASDAAADLNQKAAWRPSSELHGSPGRADSLAAPNPGAIVFNEVLAHSDEASGDWIELLNTTDAAIDVGGWFLSDDRQNPLKYEIPSGTVIAAGGLATFTESQHFRDAFALSELGDEVILQAARDGAPLGYRAREDFGASDNGVTFGRFIKSTGGKDFIAMSSPTFDAPNSGPLVGPVVIHEFMYNPGKGDDNNGGSEFIELMNITGAPVSLAGWHFEGISYAFDSGVMIEPGGLVVVVPLAPDEFRATHHVPAGAAVFGPYLGSLNNAGESLRLRKPGEPIGEVIPSIMVDRVSYDDKAPWPLEADGTGAALQRKQTDGYGNEPLNWSVTLPGGTPGDFAVPPTVVEVLVGSGDVVFSIPAGGEQLQVLPWVGINQISIRFSEPVEVSADDLRVAGAGVFEYAVSGFDYEQATQTATWTLAQPIAADKLRLELESTVRDASGLPLDGNWTDTVSSFPSGNGAIDGDDAFRFSLNVVPGDVTGDGRVDRADLVDLIHALGDQSASA